MPIFEFQGPDGKTHSIEGPDGATQEQAFQMLQKQLGGQSAPAAPQVSTASDMLRSADAGIGKGLTTLLGLPGDAATLTRQYAPQSVVDTVKSIPGAKFVYDHIPGSEALKATIPSDFSANYNKDAEYDPQTTAGRYTKAVATQAPMLATGMSVPAVLGGAVAGQAAYDATGSHLAEAGGNLLGSVVAPLALARASRTALQPLTAAAAVKAGAQSVYNGPELASAMVSPQSLRDLALNADQTLARRQFDPDAMREVRRVVDRWHNVDQPQTIADLQNSRIRLNEIAKGAPTTQTAAAGVVRGHLDDYLNNLTPSQIVAGDARGAASLLREANADYRYANSASTIGNIIQKAADKAGTQASGMNYGNLQRQGLLPLLADDAAKLKQMGFGTPDDIDAVRTATQGDFGTNLSRRASNMLGGGGGIASTAVASLFGKLVNPAIGGVAGGEEGYRNGGFLGGLAGAAVGAGLGHAARTIANARTARAVRDIQNAILERAPANAGIVARNRAARLANAAAYSRAFAQGAIPMGAILTARLNNGG